MLKQELRSLFKKYDILIAPTMPILPFKFGEKIDDPIKMFMIDIDTVIAPCRCACNNSAGGLQ